MSTPETSRPRIAWNPPKDADRLLLAGDETSLDMIRVIGGVDQLASLRAAIS